MNVSTRWLKEIVPGLEGSPTEIAEHLALRGAPVDEITTPGEGLGDIVVARVISARQHPNADRLSLCEVDGGDGVVQVVCGAPNVKADTYYPFAPVGAVLPGDFKIKKAKIRGEVSQGMLCSAKELGLGVDHDGILELDGDFNPGDGFVAALGLDDATLDVEVTANRGDLLSHVGVGRELAMAGSASLTLPEIPGGPDWSSAPGGQLEYRRGSPKVESAGVSVEIVDSELCHRFLGIIIRGVQIAPSPPWLQERLRGAGARPINNVVDATNYAMLELGHPLHAYDLNKLGGHSIVVRTATPDEKTFETLDGEKRELTSKMLMICDGDGPVGIGGVMGGLHSEVDENTTDIFLEAALFEPKQIRATRKALVMSTDASYRFERGVDPAGMERAIERCLAVILATAGGTVDGPVLDCCPVPFEQEVVSLRLARIERLLGIPFEAEYVESLLKPLGFEVDSVSEGENGATLAVRIPGYRSYDVTREVDLIEEVARTHGFDRFPDALGAGRPGSVPDHPLFRLEDELRAHMVSEGFFEAHTPSFAPPGEGDVEVANPLTTTEPFMRRALLPALLRRVEYNLSHGNRNVRLFEIGTSFRKAGSGEAPAEATHIAAAWTGARSPAHWASAEEVFEIWDLKAILEDAARVAYREPLPVRGGEPAIGQLADDASFIVSDAAGAAIGHGGRITSDSVDTPPWAGDVWGFEFTLPETPSERPVPTMVPLPTLPASERDLALLVPEGTEAALVLEQIRAKGGADLESAEIFDLYTGEGIEDGLRSIAFGLRFRSPKRTLRDKDVDKHVAKILKHLEEELGVRPRG